MAMSQACCFTDGVRIDHTESEVDALLSFLVDKNINGFVELGMHEGGLALCIMNEIPRMNYLGVTQDKNFVSNVAILKADKHRYTLILEGDTISSEIVTQIGDWLADRWPILIYCDGQNKISQVNMYKHLVRFGDFIGMHDYWNKSRIIPEIPTFPYGELKPDITDPDLKFLKHEFLSVRFEPLINTRIAILQRRTK
jgi:cephalosporin hydroxylase